ncbi:MAG: hypothetical protein EOM67_10110 [Spirochaetia bacterium]|nr:hypothetical protein [Spirochaetia bacterium]
MQMTNGIEKILEVAGEKISSLESNLSWAERRASDCKKELDEVKEELKKANEDIADLEVILDTYRAVEELRKVAIKESK